MGDEKQRFSLCPQQKIYKIGCDNSSLKTSIQDAKKMRFKVQMDAQNGVEKMEFPLIEKFRLELRRAKFARPDEAETASLRQTIDAGIHSHAIEGIEVDDETRAWFEMLIVEGVPPALWTNLTDRFEDAWLLSRDRLSTAPCTEAHIAP